MRSDMPFTPERTDRRAVVVAPRIDELGSVVRSAGYEVVGAAESAAAGVHLLRFFEPDVLIFASECLESREWESIPRLRDASPRTQVLLVVPAGWPPGDLGARGVVAVVPSSRLDELVTELHGIDRWLVGRERAVAGRKIGPRIRDRRLRRRWLEIGANRPDFDLRESATA